MAHKSTIFIHNLAEYTVVVQEASAFRESPLWYRGSGKSSYPLVPTLYRHPTAKSFEQLMQLESEIMNRFRERSLPYLTRNLDNDEKGWEWLFLMQHYGVPTRLLDWTENPLFALLFATIYADHEWDGGEVNYFHDACVWVLDPVIWNQWALNHMTYQGAIISVGDHYAGSYAPQQPRLDAMLNEPIAIYGTYNSPRIVAQRGMFTIFGRSTDPMEQKEVPDNVLLKLVIPKDNIPSVIIELASMGITDATIFPDLDGLARELKRSFGYEV